MNSIIFIQVNCYLHFRDKDSIFAVPPEYPALFDKWGRQLNGTVGPLDEGDEVQLTCRVIGGNDIPLCLLLVYLMTSIALLRLEKFILDVVEVCG